MKKKEAEEREIDHYQLNTKAVDDLVSASSENSPPVSEAELRRYTSGHHLNIPMSAKVVFTKFWFAGAACYFFLWGLGLYIPSELDLVFVTAIAMGFVMDILENNVLRFIEVVQTSNDKWIMVRSRGMKGLFLNVIYSCILMVCVWLTFNGINVAINSISGRTDMVAFGVEPLGFGLVYMGFDMLFLGLRWSMGRILADAKKKVEGEV